jgi:hypothetical protein
MRQLTCANPTSRLHAQTRLDRWWLDFQADAARDHHREIGCPAGRGNLLYALFDDEVRVYSRLQEKPPLFMSSAPVIALRNLEDDD